MPNFIERIMQRREASPTQQMSGNDNKAVAANYKAEPVRIYGEQGALTVSPWFCAVKMLATTIAQNTMEYQRMIPGCHIPTYEKYMYGDGKVINFLMGDRPNPYTTAFKFWSRMAYQMINNGNGVAYVEYDERMDVKAIWNCSFAGYDYVSDRWLLTYNRPGKGPVKVEAHMEDGTIIHWPSQFLSADGFTGVGYLKYAINALSTAATNDRQAQDIAAKGGKFKILLSEDQSNTDSMFNLLSKEQRETAANQLREQISGNYDVMEVNGLIKAQIISQDANQMNLLQSRIHDSTVVAQFTGVPLPLLMINTNNTYKAPEQLRQQFYQDTIAPMLKSLEQSVGLALIHKVQYPMFRMHFNTTDMLRLDPKLMADMYEKYLQNGVICVDEWRASLGLAPLGKDKGGEQHLVSTNLQKLDDIKLGKNQAEPTQTKTQTKTDEEDE